MLPELRLSDPIGIAGTGRLAQAIGRLLCERGEPVVCIAGRDPVRTRRAAGFIGPDVVPVSYSELPVRASRLLLAVSDGALPEVAELLAGAAHAKGVVLHTCGAADERVLAPLQRYGFHCGTIHPLQTIAAPEQGLTALPGAGFAISGDPAALHWARRIVEVLKGEALHIPSEARALYHAAAVMASNYVVALVDTAQQLLSEAAGTDSQSALRALAPLVRATIAGVFHSGPTAALTGPIQRGDGETVQRHLGALQFTSEEIQSLYRAAGLQTLDLACRKGLAPGAAQRLEGILRGN